MRNMESLQADLILKYMGSLKIKKIALMGFIWKSMRQAQLEMNMSVEEIRNNRKI